MRVLRATQPLIHERDVKAELAGVLGLELARLELDDNVSELLGVEEEQVDVKIIPSDVEVNLAADKGENRRRAHEGCR